MNNPQGQKPQSLLSMLPPEAQKQVLLLIKRLGDEKQAKEQLQRKCVQYETEVNELRKEIQKLKRENVSLRAKWESSFSMISKVRANFSGQKKNTDEQSVAKRKLRFNKEQQNWKVESEEEEQQQQQKIYKGESSNNDNLSKQPTKKISAQQQSPFQPLKYFSISSQSIPLPPVTQTSCSLQKTQQIQTLIALTAKKPPRHPQTLQQSSSRSKLSTSKKQQIESLKHQIQSLTQEIKSKQMGNMSLGEKMRRCEEIKSRYKKGGESRMMSGGKNNQSLVINNYHSPNKYQQSTNQKEYIPQQNSQQQPYTQQKQVLYNNNQKHNSNYSNYRHSESRKQNIEINNHNGIHNNSLVMNNTSIMSQHSTAQGYNTAGNTSQIMMPKNKGINKQQNQSFYDDGLMDLIEEMNR